MARRRSTKSYAAEFVVVAIAIGGIYVFLVNGGPTWAGGLMADWFAR